MLKVKHISLIHPSGSELNDVSFNVDKAEVVAIIGSNDGGKSVLGRVICDQTVEHGGEIVINHIHRSHEPHRSTLHVGYSVAEPILEPYLTGFEQLDYIGSVLNLDPAERSKRIIELSQRFDCTAALYQLIERLEANERKKLSLMSSVIHHPAVVVWDEPTAHLDPVEQQAVKETIAELKHNKASVVLITNDLRLAEEEADRIIVIEQGQIMAEGTLSQLKNKSGSKTKSLSDIYLQLVKEYV